MSTAPVRSRLGSLVIVSAGLCVMAETGKPILVQHPTLSRTQIAFSYAGDLWIVGREGGAARRLTAGTGIERDPIFSPDGTQIAFTGEYDGNVDVFTIPSAGGEPKRITAHPGIDSAVGWGPDGKTILFRSARNSYSRFNQLFTIDANGTFPSELPLPMADEGSFSPDGTHIAYVPLPRAFSIWKRYRGGRTTPIWIADLADSHIEKVPRENSNDFNPMWVGDKVYFLSDREGSVTLYSYDVRSKQVKKVLDNTGLDIKSASAGPGGIAYEQFGSLHLFDLKSGKPHEVNVTVDGDLDEVRPHFVKLAANRIRNIRLSPAGVRAVFEARGEIFTAPADKGDPRNLTNTPAANEREPAWSPDGKSIAYFSDADGEYALHIRDQNGAGDVKKIALGEPGFYFNPVWSPDSKKVGYVDQALRTWYVDVEKGAPMRVDTDDYMDGAPADRAPSWSPDSRWIAYTKELDNHLRAIFVYSVETGKTTQLTDGMSDARKPVFDKNGKYLYFMASTDIGPGLGSGLSTFGRFPTRSVYLAVLRKDLPSPLAPESDEEKEEAGKPGGPEAGKPGSQEAKKTDPVTVSIDFEGMGQRILALAIPARNYVDLKAGKEGMLYLLEEPTGIREGPPQNTLHKYDLTKRKFDKILDGVNSFEVSHDGEKMLVRQQQRFVITKAGEAPKPGEGALKIDSLEVRVDPMQEWKQMFRESFRVERDFFYDPGLHGMDIQTMQARYEPYLDRLASRADLNYLFGEIYGELSVGHLFVGGGDTPDVKRVRGGLLGADFKIENGRYRFTRVYDGENWNPQLRAPLTQPGVNVKAGEYLLAVKGRDLRSIDNLYAAFEATAGTSVVIRVGPDPSGANSREVTVVPVDNEYALRNYAWIEDNRRKVDKMTDGKVAYIYLPDTANGGYTYFNRYFFAQVNKQGAIVDERFNGGGALADWVVDNLRRPLLNLIATRHGKDVTMPQEAIFGPKAMIINEFAGSGGDAMPYSFHALNVGSLVGKRTWGGLVGIFFVPGLMDGGNITAPNHAIYLPNGQWGIENVGVPPDIDVEQDPALVRQGHDPQLEKAVDVVMHQLKEHPVPTYKRPPYPNYHGATGTGGSAK
jgi:tricorn protease